MSEKDIKKGIELHEQDAKAAAAAVSLWLPQYQKEMEKKQKAGAAAQAKESGSGGGHSAGGSGGHSQNAGAGAGAGGHGAGAGGGWGKGKSGGNVSIAEPDFPAQTQMPYHQHHHDHQHEDRAHVESKKPLAYKLQNADPADPLHGVYSERMRAKIKIEAARGLSEGARDTEILKIAQPLTADDRRLVEKSFSQQFLNSRLNAGHTLPSSHYSREAIDARSTSLRPPENQKPAIEKSVVAPSNERAKDLSAPTERADAAPAPVPRARDGGGREM